MYVGVRGRSRTEQIHRRVAGSRPHRRQGRDEVPNEPGEIVVGDIEGQPGAREATGLEPAGKRQPACRQTEQHFAVLPETRLKIIERNYVP